MVQLVDYTEAAVICVQLSKKLFENPLGRHVREREREGAKNGKNEESARSLSTRYLSIKLSSCSNNVSTRSQVVVHGNKLRGRQGGRGGKIEFCRCVWRKVRRYGAAPASNWRWLKFHGEEPPPSLSPWSTCWVGKVDPRSCDRSFGNTIISRAMFQFLRGYFML